MHRTIQRELGGGGERVLHLASRHVRQDFLGVGVVAFDPRKVRVLQLQVLQRPLVRAGCRDLDLSTTGVGDGGGPGRAAAVHEVFPDALVPRAELDSTRQGDSGGQPCSRDMGPAGGDFLDRRIARPDRVEAQGNAQVLCKLAGQVVGGAFRAMAAEVVGVRAVAGDHPELAVGQDPLQQRGRLGTGGQQQDRQQGE